MIPRGRLFYKYTFNNSTKKLKYFYLYIIFKIKHNSNFVTSFN